MFFILLLTAWVDCCSSSDIDLKHEIPEIQIQMYLQSRTTLA